MNFERNTALMISPRTLVIVSGLALAACSNKPGPIGGAPGLQVVQGEMPPPSVADVAPASSAYPVGPFDTLRVDVFGVEELTNKQVVVDNDGRASFPLAGTIDVAGRSGPEIAALLGQNLRQYVRDPQVSVQVTPSPNRAVTVYGEVNQPGVYPVPGQITLMRAVASARGLTELSNSRDVVVFRTVNGQQMATLYNLGAISRGMYADPQIYPNDTVVVGASKARRLFNDIVGAATLIATPITVFLQNN